MSRPSCSAYEGFYEPKLLPAAVGRLANIMPLPDVCVDESNCDSHGPDLLKPPVRGAFQIRHSLDRRDLRAHSRLRNYVRWISMPKKL
jgi:hypothetical protein